MEAARERNVSCCGNTNGTAAPPFQTLLPHTGLAVAASSSHCEVRLTATFGTWMMGAGLEGGGALQKA